MNTKQEERRTPNLNPFEHLQGNGWPYTRKYARYLWYYEWLNGDPRYIEAFIRSQYPRGTNVTRYVNEAKEFFKLISEHKQEGKI